MAFTITSKVGDLNRSAPSSVSDVGVFTYRGWAGMRARGNQVIETGPPLLDRCRAGADREELFRTLLAQVRASGGLDVVVVEDVHWADEATLDLLRYLSRRLRGAALLLIATYRDDGLAAGDPLRVTLGDLGSQRCTRRVGLVPLSPEAVRALAGGTGLPAPELYRLTGGNPFYVTEVLRAGMAELPPSARDAVLARAARLSAGAREVLDVAALTGARVEARLLESVTGCPPSVLDELLESGLLVGDGAWSGSATRSPGSPWRRRLPTTGARRFTGSCWARCAHSDATTTLAWLSTRRRPATARPCCGTRPPRRAAPPGWPRTEKPPRSTSGRCGSQRVLIR